MTPFQEELYRLIQDCKNENNAFTSSQEDAGNEITRLIKFSNDWDVREKFDNAQKELEILKNRFAAEKLEIEAKAIRSITKELIPIVDDLFLLLKVATGTSAEKTIKLLILNFESYLQRHEGALIRPKIGEALDPVKHKAVAVVEAPVHVGSTVEEVYRVGYSIKKQVLREAEVKVKCGVRLNKGK